VQTDPHVTPPREAAASAKKLLRALRRCQGPRQVAGTSRTKHPYKPPVMAFSLEPDVLSAKSVHHLATARITCTLAPWSGNPPPAP